ncbi:hypothetical protein FJZ19_03900 [Candidatus Pacearchaeota archaeon]|nr:hypothetical protein [Candidatus Pacearchaeota archaeon]
MWRLKYEYTHSDCKYTGKCKKLNVTLSTFPINNFTKKEKFYLIAIHTLHGKPENIKKYISYIKKISKRTEQISENIIFSLIDTKSNIQYYKLFYNPQIIYISPIIHKEGKEYIEIASWDRKILSNILSFIENSKNTILFKFLSFKEDKIRDVFLMRAIPKITEKQKQAFELAIKNNYYNYPRKINLGQLAKAMNISKSNFHEILRRAESNILRYFI